MIDSLEKIGLRIKDVVVLIDRLQVGREELAKNGYILHAVFTIDEMLEVLSSRSEIPNAGKNEGKIEKPLYIKVKRFIEENKKYDS